VLLGIRSSACWLKPSARFRPGPSVCAAASPSPVDGFGSCAKRTDGRLDGAAAYRQGHLDCVASTPPRCAMACVPSRDQNAPTCPDQLTVCRSAPRCGCSGVPWTTGFWMSSACAQSPRQRTHAAALFALFSMRRGVPRFGRRQRIRPFHGHSPYRMSTPDRMRARGRNYWHRFSCPAACRAFGGVLLGVGDESIAMSRQ